MRNTRRRWAVLVVVLVVIFAASGLGVSPAAAARCNDSLPLHPGSCGQRVSDLQWLLGGHKPNAFTEVKPTFLHPTNGSFGARTKAALFAYRYRIGYPAPGQCLMAPANWKSETVTAYLFNILENKVRRPTCWVQLAARRVAAAKAAQPTALAQKLIAYENHLVTLGIQEIPYGSNRGPAISYPAFGVPALQSATGQYGAAWCVSAQQTIFKLLGIGTFAGDTASVYAMLDYYSARGQTFAKPKVGSLIGFVTYGRPGSRGVDSKGRVIGSGHAAFVVAVDETHRTLTYDAGNDHNRFQQHTIAWGSRPYLFVRIHGVA